MKDVKAVAQKEAEVWKGSKYFSNAEQWTHLFWSETSPFLKRFRLLDLHLLVELACGHGRHGEHIARNFDASIESVICMDVLAENVATSSARLSSFSKIQVLQNDGVAFIGIPDRGASAVFCYDAMVHFHADVVAAYLADSFRILQTGGRALYHHSNYSENPGRSFGQNPHARAHMTPALFNEAASAAGLRVIDQEPLDWGTVKQLDMITLLEKPGR